MKVNKVYLEASFISFLIHASIILYLLGFFYYENTQRSVLSKPINVNLIFQEEIIKKNQELQINNINEKKLSEEFKIRQQENNNISFDSIIKSLSVEEL